METKSPSFPPSAAVKPSYITREVISVEPAMRAVHSKEFGAVATFLGTVRDTENGDPIQSITYDVYEPMAELEFEKIKRDAESEWPVRCHIRHRVGRVPTGEASVVVACAGAHRKEAFQACDYVVQMLKAHVPIWKVNYEK